MHLISFCKRLQLQLKLTLAPRKLNYLQFVWREIRVKFFSSESFRQKWFQCPVKSNSYEAILVVILLLSLCDKVAVSLKHCKHKQVQSCHLNSYKLRILESINLTRVPLSNQSFYFQNNLYHKMIKRK